MHGLTKHDGRGSVGGAVSKDLRKGSVFPTESELVRLILRSGKRLARGITHRRLNVLTEFESSAGRADVVFFLLSKKWRGHMKYGRLPARWIYALKILPFRKRFSVEEFAFLSGVSRKTAVQALLRYHRIGYCNRGNGKDLWLKCASQHQL